MVKYRPTNIEGCANAAIKHPIHQACHLELEDGTNGIVFTTCFPTIIP